MKPHMWGVTLKHFFITGVVFGLAPLVILREIIGIGLGILEDRTGLTVSDSYVGVLMVAVFLLAMLAVCIAVGNRFVTKRIVPSIRHLNVVHSTAIFSLCIVVYFTVKFTETTEFRPSFVGLANEYPFVVLQMISIPVFEILVLPTLYYFLSTRSL